MIGNGCLKGVSKTNGRLIGGNRSGWTVQSVIIFKEVKVFLIKIYEVKV